MRLRLAFRCVDLLPPDILLLDEGIGAGDAALLENGLFGGYGSFTAAWRALSSSHRIPS
jgi:hypothetical protein